MKRVLLVEDSEMFYHLLKKMLKGVGVEWTRLGEEAIERYKEKKPELVIMDVVLPDMSGIEAIKEIKKIDNNAKIIVLSGIDHDEVVQDAKKAGATAYISKSAGVNYLRSKIYEELEN